MFAITPYFAEYSTFVTQAASKPKREWRSCKVIGVSMTDDEPVYVIEVYHGGTASLTTVDEVKPSGRGNPL